MDNSVWIKNPVAETLSHFSTFLPFTPYTLQIHFFLKRKPCLNNQAFHNLLGYHHMHTSYEQYYFLKRKICVKAFLFHDSSRPGFSPTHARCHLSLARCRSPRRSPLA